MESKDTAISGQIQLKFLRKSLTRGSLELGYNSEGRRSAIAPFPVYPGNEVAPG